MSEYKFWTHKYLTLFICMFAMSGLIRAQSCDPSTPNFTFDLSGKPDSIWISPEVVRMGLCCGLDPTAKPPIRCVEFFFTLDDEAEGIKFDIASGAIPPGALGYQINCGPVTPVGEMICLSGPGPHRLTFCKPGNNPNTYSITSIPKPKVSKPTVVSDACRGIMIADGYDVSTIQWTSVPANPSYNAYLSCTAQCSTTVVTYQPGAPPYVDYQVSGYPVGGCRLELVTNITRVYFVNDKAALIEPQDPVICFGGTNATITANGIGGAPPYKYKWSTGATTQSINVGIGTYWVEISDSTSCPTAFDTVTVTAFLSPITANAGPDVTSCANNPSAMLTGSVNQATGGIWSGGAGTYAGNNTSLTATYTPTPAEIVSGKVRHVLTTTGNRNCPPSTDTTWQMIVPSPVVNAGPDKTICANNATVAITGTVSNAGGGIWSGGAGTFSPGTNALVINYTPSAAEIAAGTVTLTLTSAGNGSCNPVSDQVTVTITPAPTANAGPDQSICANNAAATLSGTVSVATGGVWSGGNGTFTPSAASLNATYQPSAAEITSGAVVLTLTSTGNGNCIAVTDQVLIAITPAPVVNAGPDQTLCANNASAALNGSVNVAGGAIWSGGTGTFAPNAATLNASYAPSPAEVSAGIVTLTLTSTLNGNCNPVSDKIILIITPAPVINAGPDRTVCGNNPNVTLAGSVTIASGAAWSGGSGLFTPSTSALNATYTPSAAEILAGNVLLTLTSTGNGNCIPVSDQMRITITPAPTANAGSDQSVCFNNSTVSLSGSISVASGGVWTGGTGSFSPNANTLATQYYPSASEKSSGSATLTLTTTGNGSCLPVSDQITISITPAPIVSAGTDITICANNASASLNGSVFNAGGGLWTGGNGTFTPGAGILNASYQPTASEIANGVVTLTLVSTANGTCLPVTDKMAITVTPAPVVNAGADQSVCSSTTSISLNGTVTNAGGAQWSSSGSGGFTPGANALNAAYTPSASDITAGTVTLTLTSILNGNCLPVSDQVVISFNNVPLVNAGPDQTVCTNNFPVQLGASGTPGMWSGGAGTFSPDPSAMNATYTPSPAEVASNSVILTFTTTLNGPCTPVSDDVMITIPPGPTANAGSSITVCADTAYIQLNGSVTVATGGEWFSTGSGSFSPDNTSLITRYIPSAADTTAGSVVLTLSSTGNGSCNPPATDKIIVNITPAPVLQAGPDVTICADTSGVPVSATVQVATGGIWSTSGTGTFTSAGALQTTYIPSAADTAARSVILTVTSSGNGSCKAVSDQVVITITPEPIVNAGLDQTVCADFPTATLTGAVYNASGGVWSSSGTGVFSPNQFSLNALYYPSAADRASGTVNLFLRSTGNGNCKAVSQSSLILSITPAPTADAGADQTVCADTAGVILKGTLTVATAGIWSTSGSGTFSPDVNALNASYTPSPADLSAGTVNITLTTTGANCINVSDQMIIYITPAPVANAGSDRTVCGNNASLSLAGTVTVASGGIWSGGQGSYAPSASSLSVAYVPSQTEIQNGAVQLVLTTTGNGSCKPAKDTVMVNITPAPVITAGPDQTLCMDADKIALNAGVTVATGGSWISSGTGVFNPSSILLTTEYYPTAKDKTDSTVRFIITSANNGNCLPVTDTMYVYFSTIPAVEAGPVSLCSDQPSIRLSGLVTVAPAGIWTTTGTGSFTPSPTVLNASYSPSVADKAAGTVLIKLTATTCKAVSDSIILYVIPAPFSSAGPDQTICANNAATTLSGTIQNAEGGIWSSLGSGNFTGGMTALSNIYIPSAADLANGSATLILATTGNGTCKGNQDTLILSITPAPSVNAGNDMTVCGDVTDAGISGMVNVASGGIWTSSGSGSFMPGNAFLNTAYVPSSTDRMKGSVTLTLTSTGNGNCIPVKDEKMLTITPAPTVFAGNDQTVCIDVDAVAFYGTVTTATGGTWTSMGSGTFDDPTMLHTIYTLSASDKTSGKVTLLLTSTGNGTCLPVKDTLVLSLTSLPTSNAGTDQTVCNGNKGIILNGTVTGASGGTWSSSGSGAFSPASSKLSSTYVPSGPDTTAGSVRLYLTTNVIGGCSVIDSLNIAFIDPRLNLPPHYCFAKNLSINSAPVETQAGGGFKWYRNDTLVTGQNNATLIVNKRGIYKVAYNFDQCTVADSTNITFPIDLTSSEKLICAGGATDLSTTVVPKGTYQWSHGGNSYGGNSNTIHITDDGDPAYIIVVTDTLLCQSRDTAYANTIPPPDITLQNVPSCIGETVSLNAVPANDTDPANALYQWFRDDKSLPQTSPVLTVNQTGWYKVIYRLGECSAKDSSSVTFYPLPVPANKAYVSFCKELQGTAIIDAGPGTRFLWNSSGNTARTDTVTSTGYHSVKIYNEYNCAVTDSIEVRDICPPRVFIPTVFSPNGDGRNDQFSISGAHFKNYKLMVFNRWGEIIFVSEDRNASWDGIYRGEPMPVGVYPWTLIYEGEFEEYKGPYKEEGSVTVTR